MKIKGKKFKLFSLCLILLFIFGNFGVATVVAAENSAEFVPGVVLVGLYSSKITLSGDESLMESSIFEELDVASVDTLMELDNDDVSLSDSNAKLAGDMEVDKIVKLTLESQSPDDVFAAIEVLEANPNVAAAQPDYIEYSTETIPNDTYFSSLYGMNKIMATSTWDKYVGDKEIVVGVMDTGTDYTHVDLIDNLWNNSNEDSYTYEHEGVTYTCINDIYGWNFADNNDNIMDYNSHGTHVAGIVGAVGNNGIGVTGVNWNVSLATLKVFSSNGGGATHSSQISAINYAKHHGIRVINASLGNIGTGEDGDVRYLAIKDYNGLFIAAAGNNGTDNDEKAFYPASYNLPNIISVGSTNENDNNVLNYGKNSVHMGAPGSGILSCVPSTANTTIIGSNGEKYSMQSGTSMAAPHVTGAAALLMAYKPELTHIEVKDIILESVDKIPQLEDLYITGGRLNVNNMLEKADKWNLLKINPSIECSDYRILTINKIDFFAEGAYRNHNIYFVINKYNAESIKVDSFSDIINIDSLGNGIYETIPNTLNIQSEDEYFEVLLYENDTCEELIARKTIYPVVFSF